VVDVERFEAQLRDAFQRAATPGNSTGVADAIRKRVAAGDGGVAVRGATAPGWGGSGLWRWLPWLGLVIAAGIVGGTVGAAGLFGGPLAESSAQASFVLLPQGADAHACVDGPVVGSFLADTRVLVVQRSDDSAWAGVQNPSQVDTTVWIPVNVLVIDDGGRPLADVPVGGVCPLTVAIEPTPESIPSANPEESAPGPELNPGPNPGPNPDLNPGPNPNPPPPGDTTPPAVLQLGVSANPCPAVVTAFAIDNVSVTQVTVTWSGVATGSAPMSLVSGTWRYNYDPENALNGAVTFSAIARDAAGNSSSPVAQTVDMQCGP